MSVNLSDIGILNIKSSDYRCIINFISKDLTNKSRTLQNMKHLFSYIKMGKEILMFGDIEIKENKFYRHKTPILL